MVNATDWGELEERERARDQAKRRRPGDPEDLLWGRAVQGGRWHYSGRAELVETSDGPAVRHDARFIPDPERQRRRLPGRSIVPVDGADLLDRLFGVVEPHKDDRAGFVEDRAEDVRRLVRRFGPLLLCRRHLEPLGHGHDWPEDDDPRCLIAGLAGPEPIATWWMIGRHALATADVIAAVRAGSSRPAYDRDWEIATGRRIADIRRRSHERRWDPRREVQNVVNQWLGRAEVGPRVRWRRGEETAALDPFTNPRSPVLAAIASQLALLAAGVDALAFCDLCGRPYRPARRPRSDRRNLCGAECRRAAGALRSAKHRRRGARKK